MRYEDWDWDGDDERPDWERLMVGLRDCAFLGPEPGVRKRGLVSLNVGWLARGGLLRLHEDGLSFTPNPLERLLGARHRRFPFADIAELQRMPLHPGEILPGGQRARIRLYLTDGAHIDLLPAGDALDDWLDAIRDVRALWTRRRAWDRDEAERAAARWRGPGRPDPRRAVDLPG